ncbi:hypothetical protein L9F63_005287, partial [Diploptera punctata]
YLTVGIHMFGPSKIPMLHFRGVLFLCVILALPSQLLFSLLLMTQIALLVLDNISMNP